MSAAVTPGPYAVFADERGVLVSTQDGTVRLARLFAAEGCDLGNAHLFAAADELAKTLQDAIEALAMCSPRTEHGAKSQAAAITSGRAALAKARGDA